MYIEFKITNKGEFLKKEFLNEGDLLEIRDSGRIFESKKGFKPQTVFKVKLADGSEGDLAFNNSSLNYIALSYGEETKDWVGKKVKVWKNREKVQGEMRIVIYLTAPDKDLLTINDELADKVNASREARVEDINSTLDEVSEI